MFFSCSGDVGQNRRPQFLDAPELALLPNKLAERDVHPLPVKIALKVEDVGLGQRRVVPPGGGLDADIGDALVAAVAYMNDGLVHPKAGYGKPFRKRLIDGGQPQSPAQLPPAYHLKVDCERAVKQVPHFTHFAIFDQPPDSPGGDRLAVTDDGRHQLGGYTGPGAPDNPVVVDEVRINLARDTTPVFDAIKEFIDSYNAIIRRLEGLLNERKTGSEVAYRPLTDEEKQGMTDRQIEEWEAIARKGIMRNDQGISNLVSRLRSTFFEQIEGAGISPSQIGLTTGNFFDGTGGQIMINEERLREAIERDPDLVADVFIRIDSSTDTPRGVGLLHKIDGLMRDFVNETQTTSIRNLEDSLKRANEQIQRMQERMFAEEDRLYRVFAAMETAMQRLNSQGSWFNAMLGQGM